MKLSDLIVKLLAIQAKEGDLDVYVSWGPTDDEVTSPYDYADPQVIQVDTEEWDFDLIEQRIFSKPAVLI